MKTWKVTLLGFFVSFCIVGCDQKSTHKVAATPAAPANLGIAESTPEGFLVQDYIVKQQRDVPRYIDDAMRKLHDEWGNKKGEDGWFGAVYSEPIGDSPGFHWTVAVITDFDKELSMSCRAVYLVRKIGGEEFVSPIERLVVLTDESQRHFYGWKIGVPETKSGDRILIVMSITGKAKIPADAKRILYTKVN